jgi:CMP-N,N'-diacetyllegionaminic acid synthase
LNNYCVFIPARGGSKGIPKKNLVDIMGYPLIYYTFREFLKLVEAEDIYVSTDCNEIVRYVNKFNKNVNIIFRPEELARDDSSSDDVLLHGLKFLKKEYKNVLYAEPTSPLRTIKTIKKTLEKLGKYKSTMTVVEDNSIMGHIRKEKFIPIIKDEPRRRQDRTPKYKESSCLYGLNINYFFDTKKIVNSNNHPIVISEKEACDLNSLEDFNKIKFYMSN